MGPLVLQVVSMGAVGRSPGQWLGVREELQEQKVASWVWGGQAGGHLAEALLSSPRTSLVLAPAREGPMAW